MSSKTKEWVVLSSKLARQVLAQLLKFEYGGSEVDLGWGQYTWNHQEYTW